MEEGIPVIVSEDGSTTVIMSETTIPQGTTVLTQGSTVITQEPSGGIPAGMPSHHTVPNMPMLPTEPVPVMTELYQCSICLYKSPRKSNVSQHVKTVHQRIKDFACPLCSYKSSRKSNLANHVKTVHENIKDFSCRYCEFKSSRKYNIVQHIKRVHKEEVMAAAVRDGIGQDSQEQEPQAQQVRCKSKPKPAKITPRHQRLPRARPS